MADSPISTPEHKSFYQQTIVESPSKRQTNGLASRISAAYREMRIYMETGAAGWHLDRPGKITKVTAEDVINSFDVDAPLRFGHNVEAWIDLINNQRQERSQIIVGWQGNGTKKPVAIGILSNDDESRRLDHFSVSEEGRVHSAQVQMIQAAMKFHDGNPFLTDAIGSNVESLRQHNGLGFEMTGEISRQMIGRIVVPLLEMKHPGAD